MNLTPKRPDRKFLQRAPEATKDAIREACERIEGEIERWARSYDADKVMRDAGFTVRATPPVAHDDIVRRATQRLRPFDQSGGGYRDTLIWLAILDIVREAPGEEIILLSEDRKAYWQADRLHPDLQQEIDRVLPPESTFRIVKGLFDVTVPSRYSGDEHPVDLTDQDVDQLVASLFANGPILAADLWREVPQLRAGDQPIGAEVWDPRNARVVSATGRPLQSGGEHLKVRLRTNASVAFDWQDWFDIGDDGAHEDLEIVVQYERHGDVVRIDPDSIDVRIVPLELSGAHARPSDVTRDSITGELLLSARLRRLLEAIGDRDVAEASGSALARRGRRLVEDFLLADAVPIRSLADVADRRSSSENLFRRALQQLHTDGIAADERRRAVMRSSDLWQERVERLKGAEDGSRDEGGESTN
ncbi:MAG: PIN domain-containing protein [Curtobacterium sp.]